MKNLFIITMLLFTIPVIAQENVQDIVQEMPSYQKDIDYVFNRVSEVISSLAEVLKIPVEQVWNILIKQQKIKALESLFFLLFGITMLYIFLNLCKLCLKNYRNDLDEYNNNNTRFDCRPDSWRIRDIFLLIIYGFCGFASSLVGIVNIKTIITGLINPEYGAIQEIMKSL